MANKVLRPEKSMGGGGITCFIDVDENVIRSLHGQFGAHIKTVYNTGITMLSLSDNKKCLKATFL